MVLADAARHATARSGARLLWRSRSYFRELAKSAGVGLAKLIGVVSGHDPGRYVIPTNLRAEVELALKIVAYGCGSSDTTVCETAGGLVISSPGVECHVVGCLMNAMHGKRPAAIPLIAFSTAGILEEFLPTFEAHLDLFSQLGYVGLKFVICDDCKDQSAELFQAATGRAAMKRGYAIEHLSEWDGAGLPGAKQLIRSMLCATLPWLQEEVREHFAPGAVGSGNTLLFWMRRQTFIWIEQDCVPRCQIGGTGSTPKRSNRSDSRACEYAFVSGGERTDQVDVDLLHIAGNAMRPDRRKANSAFVATWEAAGTDFGIVPERSVAKIATPIIAHFHLTGDGDYRAARSVLELASAERTSERQQLMRGAGRVGRTLALAAVPMERLVSGTAPFTFGTAVVIGQQPLGMGFFIGMGVRIWDFLFGDLQVAFSGRARLWVGTALTHSRGMTTSSGRGELRSFAAIEAGQWLLYKIINRVICAERASLDDRSQWLLAVARRLREAAKLDDSNAVTEIIAAETVSEVIRLRELSEALDVADGRPIGAVDPFKEVRELREKMAEGLRCAASGLDVLREVVRVGDVEGVLKDVGHGLDWNISARGGGAHH